MGQKMMSKNGQKLNPEKHQKWPKIKKPQKCQKTPFFTVFKETPKNGPKSPRGGGGSKKGVRGVPGVQKRGSGGVLPGGPGGVGFGGL